VDVFAVGSDPRLYNEKPTITDSRERERERERE
jgi:hypothetical protein